MSKCGVTIMSSEEVASGKATEWRGLDMSGNTIRNISSSLFQPQFFHITGLYLNNNQISVLPASIGALVNLTILDLSYNLLVCLPNEIGQLVHLKELLLFNNKISTLPFEIGKLFQLQNIGLQGNPLSEPFLSLYSKGSQVLRQSLADNAPIPPPPPERSWISVPSTEPTPASARAGETFTVFCYNVLCEKYATPQMYGYTPSWCLEWSYRKQQIIREIVSFNADIIALQEVATEQYHEFFSPELTQRGYSGVFHPKTRVRTMPEQEKKLVDGCCIFYRTSRFQALEHFTIDFNAMASAAVSNAEGKIGDDMLNRVFCKDNIAVLLLLESKISKSVVCCANAHIHWNPEFKDVKVIQAYMLLEEIKKIFWARYGRSISPPIVLCGDFNSLPDSGVYEFLKSGRVLPSHSDFEGRNYGAYISKGLSHPFHLKSAYASINELAFTNFTFDFKGVIDYIFYSHDMLTVSGIVGGVPLEYMNATFLGCPNPHFPSDHISLMTELKFRSK
eukprot:Sdes_comp18039_c0_seq1m7371